MNSNKLINMYNNTAKGLWSPKSSVIKSFHLRLKNLTLDFFRKLVLTNLAYNNTYSILVRVQIDKNRYGMLGNQIGFKFENLNSEKEIKKLYEVISYRMKYFLEEYKIHEVLDIQLLYVQVNILPRLKINNINDLNLPKKIFNIKDIKSKYNSKFLPLTSDTRYFGDLVTGELRDSYINLINEQNSLLSREDIKMSDFDSMYINKNHIVLNKQLSDNEYLRLIFDITMGNFECSLIDTLNVDNSFERVYKDTSLVVKDNEPVLISSSKTLAKISKGLLAHDKRNALISTPFIGSFDTEVFRTSEGLGKVYAVGFCILGQKPNLYYLDKTDLNKDILLECLNTMLTPKYDNYIFYVHNLNFDGVFIIQKLKSINIEKGFDYYKLDILFRNNNILKIDVSITRPLSDKKQPITSARKKPKDIRITFIDSYNILNQSLSKLCIAFDVENSKGYFPYSFVNEKTLNYTGVTPSIEYWSSGVDVKEYNKLYSSNWDLKNECLIYLSKDLLSLLEIMSKFNKYITRKFDVDITKSLTISRLSLNIYLKHYINDYKIPIIKDNLYYDIKNAYFGGVTEVYKPYGKNLFYYDVNSLYPYAGLNPMCSNRYTYMENLDGSGLDLVNLFGFFYCEIETKDHYIGLLPVRVGGELFMPLGKWTGWYFSEELKLAESYGYKIKVIKGYNFTKEYNVFGKYVQDLYKIKSTTSNKVEKSVAKSLLNNLLGRFGLNIDKSKTELVNKERLDLLLTTRDVSSFRAVTNNDYLVTYGYNVSKDRCDYYGIDYNKVLNELEDTTAAPSKKDKEFKDVSLVISAAISAYGRMYMSKIKMNILSKGGSIFYTDTDSIITDIKLGENLIGSDIGQFKLEYNIKEGYFLSSKTYCLITDKIGDDGKNKVVIKAKGVNSDSLSVEDFINFYNGNVIKGIKTSKVTNFYLGSVIIEDKHTDLNPNAYKKRVKVFSSNKWVDTKPIRIEDLYATTSEKVGDVESDGENNNRTDTSLARNDNKPHPSPPPDEVGYVDKFKKTHQGWLGPIYKDDKKSNDCHDCLRAEDGDIERFGCGRKLYNRFMVLLRELLLIILSLFIVTIFPDFINDVFGTTKPTYPTDPKPVIGYKGRDIVNKIFQPELGDIINPKPHYKLYPVQPKRGMIDWGKYEGLVRSKLSGITGYNKSKYILSYDDVVGYAGNKYPTFKPDVPETYPSYSNIKDEVLHEVIDKKIKGQIRFRNINDVVNFSKNYLLNDFLKDNTCSIVDCIKILNEISKLPVDNPKFYETLINKKDVYDSNYNVVSKKYLQDYSNWVRDPYIYKNPGNMVVKNKLSIAEELEQLQHYSYTMNDSYPTLNKNSIPRKYDDREHILLSDKLLQCNQSLMVSKSKVQLK